MDPWNEGKKEAMNAKLDNVFLGLFLGFVAHWPTIYDCLISCDSWIFKVEKILSFIAFTIGFAKPGMLVFKVLKNLINDARMKMSGLPLDVSPHVENILQVLTSFGGQLGLSGIWDWAKESTICLRNNDCDGDFLLSVMNFKSEMCQVDVGPSFYDDEEATVCEKVWNETPLIVITTIALMLYGIANYETGNFDDHISPPGDVQPTDVNPSPATQQPPVNIPPGPTTQPTLSPSPGPTTQPPINPSPGPTTQPPMNPSPDPTTQPPMNPSPGPTTQPPINPSPGPTTQPPVNPSPGPTTQPPVNPSPGPTTQRPEIPPRLPPPIPTDKRIDKPPTRQPFQTICQCCARKGDVALPNPAPIYCSSCNPPSDYRSPAHLESSQILQPYSINGLFPTALKGMQSSVKNFFREKGRKSTSWLCNDQPISRCNQSNPSTNRDPTSIYQNNSESNEINNSSETSTNTYTNAPIPKPTNGGENSSNKQTASACSCKNLTTNPCTSTIAVNANNSNSNGRGDDDDPMARYIKESVKRNMDTFFQMLAEGLCPNCQDKLGQISIVPEGDDRSNDQPPCKRSRKNICPRCRFPHGN